MKAPDKLRGRTRIPAIQGISSLQGKCVIVRETFFPVNGATSPRIRPEWLPPPIIDFHNAFSSVIGEEIRNAIGTCKPNSASRSDSVTYQMVANVNKAPPHAMHKPLVPQIVREGVKVSQMRPNPEVRMIRRLGLQKPVANLPPLVPWGKVRKNPGKKSSLISTIARGHHQCTIRIADATLHGRRRDD